MHIRKLAGPAVLAGALSVTSLAVAATPKKSATYRSKGAPNQSLTVSASGKDLSQYTFHFSLKCSNRGVVKNVVFAKATNPLIAIRAGGAFSLKRTNEVGPAIVLISKKKVTGKYSTTISGRFLSATKATTTIHVRFMSKTVTCDSGNVHQTDLLVTPQYGGY